jgi:serine/threonine-protein kinase
MSRENDDGVPTVAEGLAGGHKASGRVRLESERYRIGDTIGEGGMGEVVAADDHQIGREVAIKRMQDRDPSDRQIRRFVREACIQGRLEHPAMVPVHELGRDRDGLPFFAMKKLSGTTLRAVMEPGKREGFTRQRLLRAFGDVCLAIEYAHVHGVIHRDIKPENIMLGDFGEVYMLDWGVAKVIGEVDEAFEDLRQEPSGTIAGAVIGTPAFMAPEQAAGRLDIDARADVFALGRVLTAILERDGDGDAPPELEVLCSRATEIDRDRRMASARELGEGVQRYLDGDRDLALRAKLAQEHLETARAAFVKQDLGVAMRQAGRALALDPRAPGGAELVGRLLLEPPAETPASVQRALDADARRMLQMGARSGSVAMIGWLSVVPVVALLGHPVHAAVLAFTVGLNVLVSRRNRSGTRLPFAEILVMTMPALAVTSYLFTPLAAGSIACVFGFMIAGYNAISRRQAVVLAFSLLVAVMMPGVLDTANLLDPIVRLQGGGFLVSAPGLGRSLVTAWPIATLLVFAPIAIGILLARFRQTQESALRHRVHLQAWQLSQLAPELS